jgi:Na+-translocating ferredoxin:NAD+ oxidoreductase RnfD subunit
MIGRALWLGDPLSIPLHQMQNGALLIFAFFMISDPKTTPNTSVGRIVYGALVASVAYIIQFVFYEPNGPIIALILSAPLVPLLDLSMRGQIYRWEKPMTKTIGNIKGV